MKKPRRVRMTYKRKAAVTAELPFLERVRVALDVDANKLSTICGLDLEDCEGLLRAGDYREVGSNEAAFEALLTYVNERIGRALAIRLDLQRKLQEDRAARALHRQRIKHL